MKMIGSHYATMLDMDYGTGFSEKFSRMHPSKRRIVQMRMGTFCPGF
ncbi:MAG: hypothetical protein KAJ54_02985 [Candidatus Aenigmarchaeota archaeon]|nr:hypothetical protein [Candidatus Aenigmarchaeota archaeon]